MRGGTGARYPFLPPNRRWQRGGGRFLNRKTGLLANFRWGSKSEVGSLARHVRSTINSRRRRTVPACPVRAKSGNRQFRTDRMLSLRGLLEAQIN